MTFPVKDSTSSGSPHVITTSVNIVVPTITSTITIAPTIPTYSSVTLPVVPVSITTNETVASSLTAPIPISLPSERPSYVDPQK